MTFPRHRQADHKTYCGGIAASSLVKSLITALSLFLFFCGVAAAQSNPIDRSDLVLELLFEGNALDTSGNTLHGEVAGAVLTPDRFGRPDAAYAFDGQNDYIVVAPPPPLSAEAFTLSVWVKYSADAFARWWTNAIVAQDSGGDQSRRVFQLCTMGSLPTWHLMGRSRDPIVTRPADTEQWRHLAVTYDGVFHRLYLDGVFYDESEAPLTPHSEEPLYVGRKGSGEPEFYTNGAVDDVRIYTSALSPDAVKALTLENGWVPPPLPLFIVPEPPTTTLDEALVAHWTMDTSEMLDASGHGVDAIVMGSPEPVADSRGKVPPIRRRRGLGDREGR